MASESNNKYRLSKLLTDGGTFFATEFLKVEFKNTGFTDIQTFLNDTAVKCKLNSLHSNKVLKQSQMDLLYPASGTANIDDLDITLLTCIITNCFKLSASKQTTIAELRTLRNELYGHTESYQLDDNTFKRQWQKVASFLESESNTYLSADCVKTITDMRKTIEGEILTQEAAEKYYHELRLLLEQRIIVSEDHEKQMIEEMSNVTTKLDTMTEMKTKLDTVPEMNTKLDTVTEINTKLDTVTEMNTKLGTVTTEMNTKLDTVTEMNTKLDTVTEMNTKLGTVTTEMNTKLDIVINNLNNIAMHFQDINNEFRSYRYERIQLNRKGISSKQKTESTVMSEEAIGEDDSELLYKNLDQHFIDAKIVEATSKISVVDKYEEQAVDIGALMNKKRRDGFMHTLKRNRVLVLVGLPGSGKTFTALNIMSELFKENVKPIVIGTLCDFKRVLDPKQKLVVLVDDVLGQFALDHGAVTEWNDIADLLVEHIRSSNSYFIFTLRISIYQSAKSNYICRSVLNDIVVIDDKTFMKENLLQLYARRKSITLSEMQRQHILATHQYAIGFPFLCSHMNGTFETILKLFQSPYPYIEQEIQALCDNDDPQYAVLLLVALQGNKLNPGKINKGVLDAVRLSHTFVDNANEIQCTVNLLLGIFLGKHEDDISFLHDCILESTLKVGIRASRDVLISHLPFEYIKYLFSILKSNPEKVPPYMDIHKEIFPSLVRKRGKEFLFMEDSTNFLISELGEYNADKEALDHIVKLLLEFGHRYSNGKNIIHIAAATGKVEGVKCILKCKPGLIKSSDDNGLNALHYATGSGSVAAIDFLIKPDITILGDQETTGSLLNGINPETRTLRGENILHIAAARGRTELVKYISYKYKSLVYVANENGWNALHYAAEKADVGMIKTLVKSGIDPSKTTSNGSNILHLAAIYGNWKVITYVTENYKDLIHTVDNNGWNALHIASQKQNVDLLNVLIVQAGIKPDTTKTDGSNILHIAASNGNMEVVRYVTENYKDLIHTVDNYGWNALHYASQKQNVALLCLLIEAGLKPEIGKTDGVNILHIAASNGNLEVVRYITENYKDLIHTVNYNGWNALHIASQKQNVALLNVLIEAGLKPETRKTNGSNILHIAACNGKLEVVRHVTENYKDLIHTVNNNGWNALHLASGKQNVDLLIVLIEAGLKPETRKTDGSNILHVAASNGNMEVVRYVTVNYKDLIHTVNSDGWNALHLASQKQNVALLNVLIEEGLKPETRTTDGSNILHVAASNGNMEVVRYVTVNYKDLIHTVNSDGWNALHLASQKQNVALLNVLIKAGLKPETRKTDGSNILHIAASNGNMEVVSYVIENYTGLLHPVENNGQSVLHFAAHGGSVEMVKLLIEVGCDPYATISDISNILHLIAYHKDFDTVRCILKANPRYKTLHLTQEYVDFFIKSGINGYIRTKDGGNILHMSASNGNYEVVKYICAKYNSMVNTVDMNGWNALYCSSLRSSVEQFEYLISKGEEPQDTVDDYNVLHVAAANGNLPIVEYIGKHLPGLLKTSNIKGENALHCASWGGSIDTFNYLVRLGEDAWKETNENKNVLHYALEEDRLQMVKYLVQQYPDMLTSRGRDGWTCLHHAAKYSSVSVLDYLIDARLSTEEKTLDGRNIHDIAVEFGNIDLIMYIKEKG